MNIDVLISKYLDGELTPDEDIILRKTLSEDKLAKLDFDTDVSLHYAIKEDALDIMPSKEFLQATEDRILMKILANAPIIDEKSVYKLNIRRFSSLVAAMLIFTLFNISDLNLKFNFVTSSDLKNESNKVEKSNKLNNNKSVKNTTNNEQQINTINLEPVISNIIDKQNTINNYPIIESPNIDVIDDNPTIMTSKTLDKNEIQENKIIVEDLNKQTVSNDKYYNSLTNQNTIDQRDFNSPMNKNLINPLDFLSQNSDVIVSSFLSNDYYGYNSESSNIRKIASFSQSVAYSMNDNNRIGLELGSTQFSYNDKKTIYIPTNKIGIGSEVEVNNSGSNGELIAVSVITPKEQQFFWASAFYENVLVNKSDFSLIGRLGFGASNSGPLTYGRIYLNYNLFQGLYLTLGTEGKYFLHKHYEQNNLINDWRTTASFLYGLQLKF
jgi:hypothetical protein